MQRWRIAREARSLCGMEQWTINEDDRPAHVRYAKAEPRSGSWVVVLALALIAGVAAAAYWYVTSGRLPPWMVTPETVSAPAAPAAPPVAAPAPAPAPVAAAQKEPSRPLPDQEPAARAEALPTLEMSDSLARETLATLFGREAFAALFRPVELVRRVVATVDNLPRESAPRRMFPTKDVPGSFAVGRSGEDAVIDGANFARYAPYVRALAAVDENALVSAYVRAYPLFQRAYRELGYPQAHFNDRLIAAIDDMLAAPELAAPIRLVRPKVLYEFADPDLETRSAGQKLMIRMGPANAARVKAKLRDIRREIIAASEARRP
jgi:hypothetical protein